MWRILIFIVLFALLGRPTVVDTFQNEEPAKTPNTPKTPKTPKAPKTTKTTKATKTSETPSYVTRGFVTVGDEFINPMMNCPQNYEISNEEALKTQHLSENAFGYTANEYLDRSRFVDPETLKEPLPVNPDFFI